MDVLPGLAVNDTIQRASGDPVALSEFLLLDAGRKEVAYFPYCRLRQLCVTTPLTTGDTCGIAAVGMRLCPNEHPLDLRIADVVIARSEKEVCRIDAGRIVTAGAIVADEYAFRDRTDQECPRHAMGEPFTSTVRSCAPMPIG